LDVEFNLANGNVAIKFSVKARKIEANKREQKGNYQLTLEGQPSVYSKPCLLLQVFWGLVPYPLACLDYRQQPT
jgi:hypothetical protein